MSAPYRKNKGDGSMISRKNVGFVLVCSMLVTTIVHAEVPATLPVQGFLSDMDGVPVDGEVQVTFRLYDEEGRDNGTIAHEEVLSVFVAEGRFAVLVGSNTPIPDNLFREKRIRYLSVQIGEEPEMRPFFSLGSTPYAAHAGSAEYVAVAERARDADSLGGHGPQAFQQTMHSHTCTNGIRKIDPDGTIHCVTYRVYARRFDWKVALNVFLPRRPPPHDTEISSEKWYCWIANGNYRAIIRKGTWHIDGNMRNGTNTTGLLCIPASAVAKKDWSF